MRVVYVDVLYFTNLAVNYLLLLLTARASGTYVKRVRLLCGAALGALFAVLLYFPVLPSFASLPAKLLLCAAITAVTFSREKPRFMLRIAAVFAAISFAFAGGVLALAYISGAQNMWVRNGVPYFSVSLKLLLCATIVVYCLLGLVFGTGGMDVRRKTVAVEITHLGRSLTLKGLVDTGNLLRDPISGKPVIIIPATEASMFFDGDCADIISALTPDNTPDSYAGLAGGGAAFRLIPCRTATDGGGMIIAFKPDRLLVDGSAQDKYLVGISPAAIETGDGSRAIVGV